MYIYFLNSKITEIIVLYDLNKGFGFQIIVYGEPVDILEPKSNSLGVSHAFDLVSP